MKINKMLALAAIVAGVGAYAATPVAVWDGDFTTTQTDYTLDRNGNAISSDGSTITIDQSVGVKVDFATGFTSAMTVMFKYSDLTFDAQKTIATSFCNGGDENRTGVYLASGGTANGIWNTANWSNPMGTLSESSGMLAFCYSKGAGTSLYYISASGTRTEIYNKGNLKSSTDTAINGCTIGGERAKTGATLLGAATGMKITAIAIFEGDLSESDMIGYVWPSEVSTKTYTLTLNGTATNWSTGNWKRNGTSVAAPTAGIVNIIASASTEVTVDAAVSLADLTISGSANTVVTITPATDGSFSAGSATIESGVFKQGAANCVTGSIVVESGATFDMNGLASSATLTLAGAGAGNWPWALTSSGGDAVTYLTPNLTADTTIGGANKILLGQNGGAATMALNGYKLTKTGAGELSCWNLRLNGGGALDLKGGMTSFNQWTSLDGSETIDRHTTVTVRNGAELKNNAGRRLWIDTLNVESGATVTTTSGGYFGISTAFTGTCSTTKLQFNDGAVATLSGDLSVTTLVAAGDNSNSAVGAITFGLASGTSAANVIVSDATTSVGSITFGAGVKMNLNSGSGTLNVATILDISAASLPVVTGNVTIEGGATLVVPEGTKLNENIELQVCSGTLTVSGIVNVKVGSADPAEAVLTISGGTIMKIETDFETEKTFTANYPSEVPAGFTYTYVATDDVTIDAVTVKGVLKTQGPITITDLDVADDASFEVISGNTTIGGSADCKLKGDITVDAGATLTNTRTDLLSYNHSMTVDIYGTLAMGTTRWSIPGNCTFNVHAGATVTGEGDGLGTLDFISGTSKGLDVYGDEGEGSVTIEGKMRVRANESRIWIAENTTLILESGIADGGGHHAGFKQVGPGTLEIHANSTGLSGNNSVMTDGTVRLCDTILAFPIELQGDSALEIVATDSVTTIPVDVTVTTANSTISLSGEGNASGNLKFTSEPSSNFQTFLQNNDKWIGTATLNYAITGASGGTMFKPCLFGNTDSTVCLGQGATNIFFAATSGNSPFVGGTKLYFKGDVTLRNGWAYNQSYPISDRTNETVIPELGADEGVTFRTRQASGRTTFFRIENLKNFAGTIAVQAVNDVLIDNVELDELPETGALVVKATKANVETSVIAGSVTVGGETVQLVFDTVGGVSGLYAKDSSSTDGVAKIGDDYYPSLVDALWYADDGDTITLLADVELDEPIVIDYGITITGDAVTISGETLFVDWATTLKLGGSLNVTCPIEFVGDGATLVVWSGVTVDRNLMSCMEGYFGSITEETDTPDTGWTTYATELIMTEVEVTTGDATVTGVETGSYACGRNLEFTVTANEGFTLVSVTANDEALKPDATTGKYSVTVGEEKISIVVTTEVAPTMVQVTVTAENATVTNADTSEALESGTYEEGTELKFTVAANEGFTLVSVTTNSVEVVPAEDIYSVTVGEDAIEIVVTVEEKSPSTDTYEITDKTVLDENGSFEVPDGTTKIMLGEYDVTEGFEINDTTTPWTATLKKPELKETTAGGGDQFVVGDGNTVTLNVALVKGLYYGVGASASLAIDRPTPLTQYTGETGVAPLSATKPEGATGFFKVFVDIKP